LTLGELRLAIEAFNEKEKAEWFRLAWFTSFLLKPYVKEGHDIEPEDLLPNEFKTKPKRPMTKKEVKKELRELKKRLKVE
jgi:hypothetical protein